MLNYCIMYYNEGKRKGADIKVLTLYDNLKPLQKVIEEKEGKRYSLGELSDCIRYCHKWSK